MSESPVRHHGNAGLSKLLWQFFFTAIETILHYPAQSRKLQLMKLVGRSGISLITHKSTGFCVHIVVGAPVVSCINQSCKQTSVVKLIKMDYNLCCTNKELFLSLISLVLVFCSPSQTFCCNQAVLAEQFQHQ